MDARHAQTAGIERAATMQDIADRCGVSLITVSRALRDDPRVRPETAGRIRETAAALGYDPACHHAARRLALRKHGIHVINHIFATFMPGDFARANYFLNLFRGVLAMATSRGFALLTADPAMTQPLPIYTRGDVDGFIAVGWDAYQQHVPLARLAPALRGRRCPIVVMLVPVEGCSRVLTDDFGGAYAATAHLLALGHRRVLHFWPEIPEMGPIYLHDQRRAGCRQAYRDHGLNPDDGLYGLRMDHLLPLEQRMPDALRRAWAAHPGITAILLPNDGYASLAREALRALGLRVPEDISIVGFDDAEPLPDAAGRNLLTTVRVPLEAVGRAAAEMLARHVTEQRDELEAVTLPTELVVRGTTAPPRR